MQTQNMFEDDFFFRLNLNNVQLLLLVRSHNHSRKKFEHMKNAISFVVAAVAE